MDGRRAARGRARFVAAVLLLVVTTAACDRWVGVGGTPARTSFNAAEDQLGPAEVDDLALSWTAAASWPSVEQPILVAGTVYLADGTLRAYDAEGVDGCSGTPTTCQPLWQSAATGLSTPTYAGGRLYVAAADALHVYDAAGVQGCSGTPTVCTPLWTAPLPARPASPVVSDGHVYVTAGQLHAFDEAGVAGCSGAPATCAPLWSSTLAAEGGAAVRDGRVYTVVGVAQLAAYDGAGGACSGSPLACAPLWTYDLSTRDECSLHPCVLEGPPTVAGGRLYVTSTQCCSMALGAMNLWAFDAAGGEGCAGTPTVCSALATANVPNSNTPFLRSPVAVAYGTVYVSTLSLTAYDAQTLEPRWTADAASAPSVANGLVYVTAPTITSVLNLHTAAFTADVGPTCNTAPAIPVCQPVWTSPVDATPTDLIWAATSNVSGPAVAEGKVAVRTADGLRVYALP